MADQSRFLRDVRDHKMIIELDQGVHRSIRFGRPGSSAYHFRLNTWPGHLAISGDMGSYVFSRTADMFEFFRDSAMTGRINPGYWHEKADAVDRNGGAFAIYAGDQPRHTEGGISHPLRFPMLLLPDYVAQPEAAAQAVADVLNQHAGRFFPELSAQAAHDQRVLAGER